LVNYIFDVFCTFDNTCINPIRRIQTKLSNTFGNFKIVQRVQGRSVHHHHETGWMKAKTFLKSASRK
jgi:hypothetical protein